MNIRDFKKNPFFYLSIILTGVLIWQIAGIVQAQQYKSPTEPPVGGMPAVPLDTGPDTQIKSGGLTVGGVTSTRSILILGSIGTGGLRLFDNGLGIQFTDTHGVGRAGLRFEGGKLKFSHDLANWKEIGAGVGISQWEDGPIIGGKKPIYYNLGNVGIGTNNPVANLHIEDGDLQVDGDVRILGRTKAPTIYYTAGNLTVDSAKVIPDNFNPSTANEEQIRYFWGIDRFSNRMSCDTAGATGLTFINCESPNGIFIESDTTPPSKYDFFIEIRKTQGYTGTCNPPPNTINPDKCTYHPAWQKFDKKIAAGGLLYYYQRTGDVGGVYLGGDGSIYQIPIPEELYSLRLTCDISDSERDCPSNYASGVSVTSAPKGYDFYKFEDCVDYFCNRTTFYDAGDEYTLFVVEAGLIGGNLFTGSLTTDAVKIKGDSWLGGSLSEKSGLMNWFVLSGSNIQCTDQNRGEIRFLKGDNQDRLCVCSKEFAIGGGSVVWRCF